MKMSENEKKEIEELEDLAIDDFEMVLEEPMEFEIIDGLEFIKVKK